MYNQFICPRVKSPSKHKHNKWIHIIFFQRDLFLSIVPHNWICTEWFRWISSCIGLFSILILLRSVNLEHCSQTTFTSPFSHVSNSARARARALRLDRFWHDLFFPARWECICIKNPSAGVIVSINALIYFSSRINRTRLSVPSLLFKWVLLMALCLTRLIKTLYMMSMFYSGRNMMLVHIFPGHLQHRIKLSPPPVLAQRAL